MPVVSLSSPLNFLSRICGVKDIIFFQQGIARNLKKGQLRKTKANRMGTMKHSFDLHFTPRQVIMVYELRERLY